jgi:hypothetical protein
LHQLVDARSSSGNRRLFSSSPMSLSRGARLPRWPLPTKCRGSGSTSCWPATAQEQMQRFSRVAGAPPASSDPNRHRRADHQAAPPAGRAGLGCWLPHHRLALSEQHQLCLATSQARRPSVRSLESESSRTQWVCTLIEPGSRRRIPRCGPGPDKRRASCRRSGANDAPKLNGRVVGHLRQGHRPQRSRTAAVVRDAAPRAEYSAGNGPEHDAR